MTENKMQPTKVESNSRQTPNVFQANAIKASAKETHKSNTEIKPVYKTYIYRSYGGGYQGL